jgi:TonB family protein
MRLRLGLFICVAGVAAASAYGWPQSQTSPSSVAPQDSVKISQIRRLLEVMGIAKQMPATMRSMIQQMQSSTKYRSSADASVLASPQTKQFSALLQERAIAKLQTVDVVALFVPIFDKHYTLDDINALIAFYESPVGQKTLQLQPQISVESMQSVVPTIQKIMKESEDEIRKEHPELDTDKAAEPAPASNVSNDHPVQRITMGGDTVMATAIHRVQPEYSESARSRGIQGTVRVHTLVDKDGKVIETKYVSGPPELAQAAIDAVKQWRFKPTTLQGIPVQVECVFEVNFRMGG